MHGMRRISDISNQISGGDASAISDRDPEAEKLGDKTLRLRSFAALRKTILGGRDRVGEEQQTV
jgi:hypothetical protein